LEIYAGEADRVPALVAKAAGAASLGAPAKPIPTGTGAIHAGLLVAARDPALATIVGVGTQIGLTGAGELIAISEALLALALLLLAAQIGQDGLAARLVLRAFLLECAAASGRDGTVVADDGQGAAREPLNSDTT